MKKSSWYVREKEKILVSRQTIGNPTLFAFFPKRPPTKGTSFAKRFLGKLLHTEHCPVMYRWTRSCGWSRKKLKYENRDKPWEKTLFKNLGVQVSLARRQTQYVFPYYAVLNLISWLNIYLGWNWFSKDGGRNYLWISGKFGHHTLALANQRQERSSDKKLVPFGKILFEYRWTSFFLAISSNSSPLVFLREELHQRYCHPFVCYSYDCVERELDGRNPAGSF